MSKPFRHHPLDQSRLYKLKGLEQLAEALLVPIDFIEDLADIGDELYQESLRPKKGSTKKMRLIENPHITLKSLQKRIARLLTKIEPPNYLFNPVKKKCAIMNAAHHQQGAVIWAIDVRKYFPNTTPKKVFEFFHLKLKCAQDVALILTNLTTRYDYLPTGAPSSPIIAFYANEKLWSDIYNLCESNGLTMSLYQDDLTISGDKIRGLFKGQVLSLIRKAGLIAHKQKTAAMSPMRITGPIVARGKIDAPNSHYKNIRLLKKKIRKAIDPVEKEHLKASLKGHREYTKQIRRRSALDGPSHRSVGPASARVTVRK